MSDLPVVARKPLRRSGLFLRQSGKENAVYNRRTGNVHLLNETAWAIWDLCDGATSLDEMIEAICEISSLHRDVVTEDVERIVSEFVEAGLVSWVG